MYVPVGDGSTPSTEQTQLITSAALDRHMPKSARVLPRSNAMAGPKPVVAGHAVCS